MHVPGRDIHQFVLDALSRLCENDMPPKPVLDQSLPILFAAMESTYHISNDIYNETR